LGGKAPERDLVAGGKPIALFMPRGGKQEEKKTVHQAGTPTRGTLGKGGFQKVKKKRRTERSPPASAKKNMILIY